MAKKRTENVLRIGDFVTFKCVKHEGLMCAEGILKEDLNIEGKIKVFHDALFCIHLQRQYSAARELDEFLRTNKIDPRNIVDPNTAKYYQALKRGCDNERKLNDSYMKKKNGQVVVFGDIIQLYHVKSGKYLTVIPDRLARDERENIKVVLDNRGNSFSWLQLCPRFKIDREGDRVLNHADIYLRVSERANEFVHRADRDPYLSQLREVNCSLEVTYWKLGIFQSSADSIDRSLLLGSELVYINDPETRCSLTISTPPVESLDDESNHHDQSQNIDKVLEMPPPSPSSGMVEVPSLENDEVNQLMMHDHGNIVLQSAQQDYINPSFLWFIEKSSALNGGPISLKSDQVRFKHMNSSVYLKAALLEDVDSENSVVTKPIFVTTADPEDPGTLFSVKEVNASGKFLSNAKAVQFVQSGVWIERGDVLDDGRYAIRGGNDKSIALSLVIQRYIKESEDKEERDDSHTNQVPGVSEPLDVYIGLSARFYLQKFLGMTVIPKNDSVNTLWPSATRVDLPFFQSVVQKLIYFCNGFPLSVTNIILGIDKGDGMLSSQRQILFLEQGIVEVVLKLINKLVPVSERLDEIKNMPKKKKKPISDGENSVLEMGQMILSQCFLLLFNVILGCPENQMFVADFMPVLLAHLNSQPLAGKCVTEMLSKNMELQETKIGTREIQIFVDKLRASKMNAMYLQLLQACCSCQGDGVDGNQCKVANMLFSNTNDIIIMLHADFSKLKPVDWWDASDDPRSRYIYVPKDPSPGSPLRAEGLRGGLPQLSLSWTTNSIDFSPLGLFGRLSVNVEDLFGIEGEVVVEDADAAGDAAFAEKRMKAKKAHAEQKNAVANYFIAEMFLGAEMCMDRNYIAMHKLDDLFPYEVLVTVLKLNVANSLKSAAVRLLMCLYVDRDPQAASCIPCLTRAWSDIEKNSDPQLPFVDVGRQNMFGYIQQVISDHIKGMRSTKWDDLSRHMLKMLSTMIRFNFYGRNDRMRDVIEPLIAALDRRFNVSSRSRRKVQAELLASTSSDDALGMDSNSVVELTNADDLEAQGDSMDNVEGPSLWSRVRETFGILFAGHKYAPISPEDDSGELETQSEGTAGTAVTEQARTYHVPTRYSKAPMYELETMVEAVDILAFAQTVVEDRNISLLLRHFYSWHMGVDSRSPAELFEQAVKDSQVLAVYTEEFDDVMIDILMYEHTPLVQSTLEVLMAHHSMQRTLLDNATNVQLLVAHHRERQYRLVDQMLKQLEQNAETHELWGELETDADHAVNKQTKDIIKELIDICRIRRQVLEFDEDFMADSQIQDLYRNLGCFEISMKVMGLLDSVEEDESGELGEVALNTRDLCLLCNTLLYWFFLGNPKNQEMGYGELDFFLDSLDQEINSHLIIQAIFKNNEALMRQVPHSHLAALVDRIIKNGKSPHYLSLFAAITNVGERNIKENQLEVVKSLTSPGRLQKVACFFVPIDHPDYEEKRKLMAPFLETTRDLSLEDLPPLLSYHLMFLEVLSGCTVGRMDLRTVEAKVQSVFSYVDILQSILDPGTIVACKIRLSKFFYNSVIEVELKIPGLDQSPDIWKLLESYKPVLLTAKDDLERVDRVGWASVSRQRIEYIVVCISIIHGFFTHYYQAAVFQSDEQEKQGKSQFSLTHVDDTIIYFFTKIKEIHDLNSTRLSDEVKNNIYEALMVLNRKISGATSIVTTIRPPQKASEATDADDAGGLEITEDPEAVLIGKYRAFLETLERDPSVQYKADNENVTFITILEKLPFIADRSSNADVRYESLIKKLVYHIRENIKIVNGQKRLDARVTKTAIWIIRAFRTMIENRMGMSIYERDDEGGQEQDIAAAPVVNALNSCGGTALCLDLIADGIDEKLQLEAVRLGVGLLFKEGGALEVQTLMNTHLSSTSSELFFKQVRITLQKLIAWHEWNETIFLPEGQEPKPPDEILIVRFLQLMCEGHYLPNQDIMREQPNNSVSYNLLDDFVLYLNCLSRFPCRTSTVAGIRVAATILEVIQGPCEGNQVHFTLNTELIETLNRLNRAKMSKDSLEDEEVELKKTSIDIFQALLEGQGEKSVVYERVLSVIHLDIIQMMSKGLAIIEHAVVEEEDGETLGDLTVVTSADDGHSLPEANEEMAVLQTECVVLLQMLCNFKPSLYDELGISRNIEDIVGSGTAMIEVIWRGDIHRRFFHVPNVCSFLAKSSKDALVEYVDRSNAENKLIDFLNRAQELYREVKHQQLLTEMNISGVFSRSNQNRATWISFALAAVINVLMLFTYEARNGHDPSVSSSIDFIISILGIIQSVVAGFVLLIFLVVRIPIKYQSMEAQGHSKIDTVIYTAMEPMTLYYIWYLTFSILGQVVAHDFFPFLLLDIIVKNSTTRDVLNAVIYPRRQIMMGGVVIVFVVQIYAFFLFLYFRDELQDDKEFCSTFYGCFKITLGYGLLMGGGAGDIFNVTVKQRWLLDMSFYFVVNIGMLNLIGGVIITTFGQLRENKAKRLEDTDGVCFICNIDKQVFDRASTEPDGFKTHIKIDHNMWNYLYFIFLLWEQDRDDDDGLEQYVRRAIDANEITWMPLHKAIRLNQAATKEESLLNSLIEKSKAAESAVANKLDKVQTEINTVLEQLNQTLKADHIVERPEPSKGPVRSIRQSMMAVDGAFYAGRASPTGRASKVLFALIREVCCPLFEHDKYRFSVYCNIYFEGGMFTIKGLPANRGVVKFPTDEVISLVEGISPGDERVVTIQVMSGVGSPADDEEVALFYISIDELFLAEGCYADHYSTLEDYGQVLKLSVQSLVSFVPVSAL